MYDLDQSVGDVSLGVPYVLGQVVDPTGAEGRQAGAWLEIYDRAGEARCGFEVTELPHHRYVTVALMEERLGSYVTVVAACDEAIACGGLDRVWSIGIQERGGALRQGSRTEAGGDAERREGVSLRARRPLLLLAGGRLVGVLGAAVATPHEGPKLPLLADHDLEAVVVSFGAVVANRIEG